MLSFGRPTAGGHVIQLQRRAKSADKSSSHEKVKVSPAAVLSCDFRGRRTFRYCSKNIRK